MNILQLQSIQSKIPSLSLYGQCFPVQLQWKDRKKKREFGTQVTVTFKDIFLDDFILSSDKPLNHFLHRRRTVDFAPYDLH